MTFQFTEIHVTLLEDIVAKDDLEKRKICPLWESNLDFPVVEYVDYSKLRKEIRS